MTTEQTTTTPSTPTTTPSRTLQARKAFLFPPVTTTPSTTNAPGAPTPIVFDVDEDSRNIRKQQLETVCSVICTELDPRSIARWPAYFSHSVAVACQVLATVRFIQPADVIAGLINACLLFTFAAVFSSAVFGDIGLDQYVALGTGCNLVSVVLLQTAFTLYSDAGVNVVGPDFNPTIFLATMAEIIKTTMQENKQREFNAGRRLDSTATESPTSNQVRVNPEALLSTVLAMIMVASATFGVFIYMLGRLKISRGIQLVPGSVLAGFMASIGYLVALKAIKTTMPHHDYELGPAYPMFWAYFLPSLPIGIVMYLQRRLNYGNPIIFLPIILVLPLALFFIIVYASGSDIEQARAGGWLFASFSNELFFNQFVESYGRYHLVDWNAVAATAPTMVTMMIIVAIEAILKQATTRKLLKAHDLRIDHELMLAGKTNILVALCAGVVGYPQPKLTYINYGILRNSTSRISGMIIVVFNGALFFAGFPLVNYLPRFWLAGILFFAAMGFLVENLLDSFKFYSLKEFACIWAIVIVNAILGLLWAVIVGVVLAALIFALAYSRGGAIKAIFSGSDYRSSVYRTRQEEAKLQHLASKVVVVQLHRYIFFGSSAYVNEVVSGLIKEQDTKCTEVRRASHFIFDWQHVENIDMTALGVFNELMLKLGVDGKRQVIFTGLSPKLRRKLAEQNVVQQIHAPAFRKQAGLSRTTQDDVASGITGKNRRCFDTLDRGMEFVEDALLEWSVKVRQRWFHFPALQDFYVQSNYWNLKHSFDQILKELLGRDMNKFFDSVHVPQGWTVCKAGDFNHNLYVLTEGSLTVMLDKKQKKRNMPTVTRLQTLRPGAFVNEDSLYEQFAVPYTVVADVDSTVLALSREGMNNLERQFPLVAIEIHRRVLNHSNRSRRKIVSMLHSLNLWDQEFAAPVNNVPSSPDQAAASASSTDNAEELSTPLLKTANLRTVSISSPTKSAMTAAAGATATSMMEMPTPIESMSPTRSVLPESTVDVEAQVVSASPRLQTRALAVLERQSSTGAASSTGSSILESTRDAAHVLMSLPATMANAANAALAGFKDTEESEEEGSSDNSVFDTHTIRDGMGEEDGKMFAQRLLRRRTSALTTNVFDSVQAFRAQRGLLAEDAGEAAVLAIYQHVLATTSADSTIVEFPGKVAYCLHTALLSDAKTAFAKVAIASTPAGELPTFLPRKKLNVALAGIGLFTQQQQHAGDEEEESSNVSLDEFLRLAVELHSPPLKQDLVNRLYAFFTQAVGTSSVLTVDVLTQVLLNKFVSPLAFGRFTNVWGDSGGVNFNALCSAVAHQLKTMEMDFQIEQAWRELNNGTEYCHTEDVATKIGLDLLQSQEMIWEADLELNDALTLFELLETLSYNHMTPENEEKEEAAATTVATDHH